MSHNDFVKAMSYLDAIESELNKIAESVGHASFEEFFKEEPLQKAA